MKVLIACEYSGTIRDAFRAHGHDAWSCDLMPTHVPGPHIEDNVLNWLDEGWDLMIAHPPCTYLANSGVHHLKDNPARWEMMQEGAKFFLAMLNAPIPRICVENPVMHGYAKEFIGRDQDQTTDPYQFGDPWKKRTCFWLKGLPPLRSTNVVTPQKALCDQPQQMHRAAKRAKTAPGMADAMAQQWGSIQTYVLPRRVKMVDAS